MFKNNNLARDTHWEHLHRSQLCAVASATHEAELGLRPLWVADIAKHATGFEAQLDTQNLEDAEYHGAVADMKSKREALYDMVGSARWMIKTIIDDPALPDGDRRLIDDVFDIDQALDSKSYERLYEAVEDILTGQQKLDDMGASWKLPAAMITNLTDAQSGIRAASETLKIEHGEKLKATEDLYTMRDNGENLLRNIFRWCIAVWGDDEERLLEFGFVPKSQIWTENKPPHPAEFEWDEVAKEFQWSSVEGVDNYEIDYRLTGASGKWTQLYFGSKTSMDESPAEPGEYDFRIRSWSGDDWGAWSGDITVNFPDGGALPAPTMLMYDEMRNTFTWQAVPEATGYELEIKNKQGETTTYEMQRNHQKAELAKGKYRAKVRAIKEASPREQSDWSVEIEFAIEFAAPKYFKYNPGQHEFSWDAVAGATLYQLVQDSVGNMLYMGAGTSFEYKFEGEHKFRVRALNDETGKWGQWSEWLEVAVPA